MDVGLKHTHAHTHMIDVTVVMIIIQYLSVQNDNLLFVLVHGYSPCIVCCYRLLSETVVDSVAVEPK
jgi:hypothetical protein